MNSQWPVSEDGQIVSVLRENAIPQAPLVIVTVTGQGEVEC